MSARWLACCARRTTRRLRRWRGAQTQPSMRSFVTYDPGPALDALDVPVLAFFGGKDLQVPPTQSEPVLRKRLDR